MSTHRRISLHVDLRTTCLKKPAIIDKYPARRFPIQGEIQRLEDELSAFNERIVELKAEGSSRPSSGGLISLTPSSLLRWPLSITVQPLG
jgi:hypothetical protein